MDYAQNNGSQLLALDSGNVNQIYCTLENNWTNKIIKIDGDSLDYGFGHIFFNGNPDWINV